jgi:hypothetical protein
MGWYIGPTNGMATLHHEGDNANSSAAMLIVPEKELGIMVMMNVNGTFMAGAHRQIATGVMAALMGGQPQPYQPPEDPTKVVGSVVVPATASVLWIAWMVYRFIRRRRKGSQAKRGALWILWVIVLPLAVDIGLLWVLSAGIPTLWGLPMNGLVLMFPDMATLVFGSAAALAGWGLARTALTLSAAFSRPRGLAGGSDHHPLRPR